MPSICPFDAPLEPVARRSGEQLELDARAAGIDDEDAFRVMAQAPDRLRWPVWLWASSMATAQDAMRVRHIVGARGQDDRHAGAEHDAGRIGLRKERQVLGQHVAGFEVRHDQNLRLAGDRRLDALDAAASGLMALSKASGPSSSPPVIWPRSAILHSAAASIVEGMARRHGLDRREDGDLGRAEPERRVEIDGVLDDVALGHEVRRDVHGGVGDEERLRMCRARP